LTDVDERSDPLLPTLRVCGSTAGPFAARPVTENKVGPTVFNLARTPERFSGEGRCRGCGHDQMWQSLGHLRLIAPIRRRLAPLAPAAMSNEGRPVAAHHPEARRWQQPGAHRPTSGRSTAGAQGVGRPLFALLRGQHPAVSSTFSARGPGSRSATGALATVTPAAAWAYSRPLGPPGSADKPRRTAACSSH
jgi:hypothetical protein